MRTIRVLASLVLTGFAFAAGCGSTSTSEATGDGSGGSSLLAGSGGASGHAGSIAAGAGGSGAAGAGGAASGHGGAGACSPACGADQKCSVTGVCLALDGCAAAGDCPAAGTVCDPTTKKCIPGGGCGTQKIPAAAIPSNLIIALDRSCSMTQKLTSGKTKWETAVAAIDQMTKQFAMQIRFGLALFPTLTGDKCAAAGPLAVPIGDATGPKIQKLLDASLVSTDKNFPNNPCTTPIDGGMHEAATDPALMDGMHPSFALLMTDGEQSAGCTTYGAAKGATTEIAALAKMGIPTFVVGFGGQVNVAQLDAYATAGGMEASPTSPKFYQAEDAPSLDQALAAIAGKAIGCTFSLGTAPPDPSMLYTFFDKKDVPRDPTHMSGWDYDAAKNEVTVYGAYCDSLKAGQVKVVDIVFGCDVAPG